MPRMLDLFCGRWGWGKAFAATGWEVVGIDLVAPPEIPEGCEFIRADILGLTFRENGWWITPDNGPLHNIGNFDFICASTPCERFSVHGMKHFHPTPKYPEMGIRLFEHTRAECERCGTPYVMENVRPARDFVGTPVDHCGPFYLWGNAVPTRMPRGVVKGMNLGSNKILESMTIEERRLARKAFPMLQTSSGSAERKEQTAKAAEIPAILAQAVLRAAEDPTRRRRKEIQQIMDFAPLEFA